MFSYPSVLTNVLGAQKNRLIKTVLLSTHNICFVLEIRIFFWYTLLTKGLQEENSHLIIGKERLVIKDTPNSFIGISGSVLFIHGWCIGIYRLMYVPMSIQTLPECD